MRNRPSRLPGVPALPTAVDRPGASGKTVDGGIAPLARGYGGGTAVGTAELRGRGRIIFYFLLFHPAFELKITVKRISIDIFVTDLIIELFPVQIRFPGGGP